jgi:hypothetical protein
MLTRIKEINNKHNPETEGYSLTGQVMSLLPRNYQFECHKSHGY